MQPLPSAPGIQYGIYTCMYNVLVSWFIIHFKSPKQDSLPAPCLGDYVFYQVVARLLRSGREEGRDEVALLPGKLPYQNRFDDGKEACKDKQYRMQLLKSLVLSRH